MNDIQKVEPDARAVAPLTQIDATMALIERVATSPDANLDKLEKLLEMQEKVMQRQAEIAFNHAFRDAQSEIEPVAKNKINPETRSKYADIAAVNSAILSIANKHGISVSFGKGRDAPQGYVRTIAYVSHIGGHTRIYEDDFPIDNAGIKGTVNKTPIHARGSTNTYARRYMLFDIFNVSAEDDDGNSASRSLITDEQAETVMAKAANVGADLPKFLRYMNVDNVRDIRSCDYKRAIDALDRKAATCPSK